MKKLTLLVSSSVLLLLTYCIGTLNVYAQCGGIERWEVKVLADDEKHLVNFDAIPTTVNWLRKQKVKRESGDKTRQGIEFKTYAIKAYVKFYKYEPDGDLHIIVADTWGSSKTMVVEVPGPDCKLVKSSGMQDHYQDVWDNIEKNTTREKDGKYYMKKKRYTIYGVAFMDFDHNQTGMAPNNLELHPVFYFK